MGKINPKYLIVAGVLCVVAFLSAIPAMYLLYIVDEGKSTRLGDVKPNVYNISISQSTEIRSDPMAKERLKMRLENKKAKASEKTVSLLYKLTTEIVILPTLLLEDLFGSSTDTNYTETENSTITTSVKSTIFEDDEKDVDDEPGTTSERTLVWSKKVKKRSGKRKKRNKKTKKISKKAEIHTATCANI